MPIKYLTEESVDPYHNLAAEWVLTEYVPRGTCILYLWQNRRTVVIGRNQDPFAECRVEEFTGSGGKIARRKSGGGAVYHDLGNLNYSFIYDLRDGYENAYREILLPVLSAAGIPAEFNERNDILFDGRKISGYASFETGTKACRHGTLLLDTDIGEMERWLTPDREKERFVPCNQSERDPEGSHRGKDDPAVCGCLRRNGTGKPAGYPESGGS